MTKAEVTAVVSGQFAPRPAATSAARKPEVLNLGLGRKKGANTVCKK